MRISLHALNTLPARDFTAALGAIFEHSPWVADAVCGQRPFASIDALHRAMCAAVADSTPERQRALIGAHPELGATLTGRRMLTAASAREQSGAGLDRCDTAEAEQLRALNARYRVRFGFPFILAVRGYDRQGIIANLEVRLLNSVEQEARECLEQIYRIARFRLEDTVDAGNAPGNWQ